MPFVGQIQNRAKERGDAVGLSSTIDLVADEGRYHNNCRIDFFRCKRPKLERSPTNMTKEKAFECLKDFLIQNEECQYSINELSDIKNDYLPDGVEGYCHKTLLAKLKAHFTTSIRVTHLPGRNSIVVFRDAFSSIVHDKWYQDRLDNSTFEKNRITVAASKLVSADIREKLNNCDEYLSPSSLQKV